MHYRRFRYRTMGAAACLLFALLNVAPASASEDGANASAEAAGERAHFLRDFCGSSPDDLAHYKEKLRKILTEASDFDTHWQTGWRLGERNALQLRALQLNSPAEFATRVKSNCERVRWQADNSLRPRLPK